MMTSPDAPFWQISLSEELTVKEYYNLGITCELPLPTSAILMLMMGQVLATSLAGRIFV
jgi:hypothetical protein